MDDEECKHGIWPATSCSLCNGREKREQTERDRVVWIGTARYAAVCAGGCGDFIEPGDRIVRTAADRYLHHRCQP